jgi:iron complex outermembrane receptor protein
LTGVDFYRNPGSFVGESIEFSDLSLYIPIDLYNPQYGTPVPAVAPYTHGDSVTQFTGVYLQDQIKIFRRLGVTLGGRFDHASNFDSSDPSHISNAFTPRVGVTYEILPGASLYASFSKSFLPQSGRQFDGSENGSFVPPERGQQWEGGVKTALLGGRLSTTLAIYNLSRTNVTTSDAVHPNFYSVTGQQRSRGVELELTLQLLPGWNVTAAYSLIDAKVTDDTDIPVGTPTQNAPRHSVNIWSTYEVRRTWLRGLGVGFGGRAYTNQSGDLFDTFKIPGYGLLDASPKC